MDEAASCSRLRGEGGERSLRPEDGGQRAEGPRGKLERYCLLPLRGLLVAKQYLDCTCTAEWLGHRTTILYFPSYCRTFPAPLYTYKRVQARTHTRTRVAGCARAQTSFTYSTRDSRLLLRTGICTRMHLRVLARYSTQLASSNTKQISVFHPELSVLRTIFTRHDYSP